MSATNRGAEREEEDTYITHPWCVERLFDVYPIPEGAIVCDPCAAGGELLAAIKKIRPDLTLFAFEIKESETPKLEALKEAGVIADYRIGDFLAVAEELRVSGESAPFDYVITNPPYALAQEMVLATFSAAKRAAIHLLRINFLGGRERREFTDGTRPGLKILPNRPCFTGWGSDATEYAWFIYGDETAAGSWEVCPVTPLDVVKAANKIARERYPHLNPKTKKSKKDLPAEAGAIE